MEQQQTPAQAAGTPEKLVGWKNAPTLLNLKQDLSDGKQVHDRMVQKISEWLDNLNVEGKAKIPVKKGQSSIVPKLIRKQAEWRYPALSEPFLSTSDLFNVKPVTWEDTKAAQQNQLVLNHQFNTQINKQKFIDDFVRTAVDEGTVVIRTGWDFEEEEVEELVPDVRFVINPEFAPTIEYLTQLEEESPSEYETDVPEELKLAHQMSIEQGQPVEPRVMGQVKKKRMKTVRNKPTVEICDYRNLVLDPTAKGDITKANFAVFSFETSKSELKKDKRYKNVDFINVSGETLLSQPDNSPGRDNANGSFNFNDDARKKFWVHEYWGFWDIDGSGKTKPFVAAWAGETLLRMEENPFPDKALPFTIVQYLPVRRSNHGEPDGALLEDNQRITGAVTRGMIDIMGKSASGQTGMRKDMLDATNRRKYESGQDYEFNQNVDPRQGVHMHVFPEIPASAQFMLQLQNMEAESLTGVKSWSQGIGSQALGDVAAGIRGALDASSKRELGILRRLSAGIVSVGRKFIAMNSEFLSEKEIIRITNEQFVTVKRDDLQGNFDLELSISTAEEDNNKAQELAFMLQTMGNNMDPAMSRMILADIARLRKMPELAKRIEKYQPQPDPLMEEKMRLEIALLSEQVNETRAKVAKLYSEAQLAGVKQGTEMAKAGNLQSDADLKNLNFVEQESGVKQARDKELHGAQAQAQGELKLLDIAASTQQNREKLRGDLLKEYVKARAKPKKQ